MRRLFLPLVYALFLSSCMSLRPFDDIRREVPAERFVSVDGHLVHVEQAGQGEPLVLVHGFGASTYSWREVIPRLAESNRVVAVDLYGFGYTERPRNRRYYTREGQTGLILGALDALGIRKAHFMGNSYGGALTLWVASRHPERVCSMVLVDSAAPTYPDDRRSLAALPPFGGLFLRLFALRPGMVRKALEASYYDDSLVTPELVQAYYDRVRVEGVKTAYYGLTAPVRGPRPRIDLEAIDIPALVVWGEEDQLISVDLGRRVSARLPRSEFVVMEKTGHLPMAERPEEFLRIVEPFLARQKQGVCGSR